jgi:prepilin peptidase CpaA
MPVNQFTDIYMILFLTIVLFTAVLTDVRSQKIPNWLIFPAAFCVLAYHCATAGISGFIFSLGGMAAGTALLILPYLHGGMGAGDAKLLGVVGGVLGAKGVFYTFLLSAIIGGLYAVFLTLIYRKQFRGFYKNQVTTLVNFFLMRKYTPEPASKNETRPKLCYGLAVALGTSIYLILTMTKPGFFIL